MELSDFTLDGLCAQTDPEIFFPEKANQWNKTAQKVCARCPVREECLRWAVSQPDLQGIWGGTTWQERVHLRMAA